MEEGVAAKELKDLKDLKGIKDFKEIMEQSMVQYQPH